MARLVLEQLSKVYSGPQGQDCWALRELTLALESAELLVLVGPSGCGKSSTLRLIAGLEEPTAGRIHLEERELSGVAPAQRDVAMVFQNPALYPHLSVFENLAFGLRLRQCARAELQSRVQEVAQGLGLSDCLERLPAALSGGQRQRVALGRALVRRPKLFLFDEPFSQLDAPLRQQLRAELARCQQQLGTTSLYVTHDQAEAMTLGKRIGVLLEGRLQQVGPPLQLYRQPANRFVASFIGSPPMNFFPGRLLSQGGQLSFQVLAADGAQARGSFALGLAPAQAQRLTAAPTQAVLLGLRPEQVRLEAGPDGSARLPAIEARVERLEALGPELLVYLKAGTHSFVARVPAHQPVSPQQTVRVSFEPEQGHFFDAAGRAL